MNAPGDPSMDRELLKSFRDPLRRRVLIVLADKPAGVSIRQLAERLQEPPRRVRHAIETLLDVGLIAIAEERSRRGTIERAYRALRFPMFWLEKWPEEIGPAESKVILLDILRFVFDAVASSIAAGTYLERPGFAAARTWREVDSQGWDELAAIHRRAIGEVVDAVERSSERLAVDGEEPIPAISAMLLFEALPWGD